MHSNDDITARTLGFHIDAFRLSFAIAMQAHARLWQTLAAIESAPAKPGACDVAIAAAFSDAWHLIDVLHRVRELAQQSPLVRSRLPGPQVFLRATRNVEDLRHHVQHLRSGIPRLGPVTSPLFGYISWVATTDDQRCLYMGSGSPLPATEWTSCTYDREQNRFVQRLLLGAAGAEVELEEAYDHLAAFVRHLQQDPTVDSVMKSPLGTVISMKFQKENGAAS